MFQSQFRNYFQLLNNYLLKFLYNFFVKFTILFYCQLSLPLCTYFKSNTFRTRNFAKLKKINEDETILFYIKVKISFGGYH